MPGGALISLTSYGTQNVLLNGNPDFTYFYKVYKKYSHFATESVTIPLDGPNELFYDQEITVRAKIPRVTDLISELTLTVDLPDIYSKYIDPNLRTNQYEFQWVSSVGAHMIKRISFTIGGSKIQEFDSEYIIARANLDQDYDTLQKWRALVGDVPEMTDPARGIYAGGSEGIGYPSVVQDPTQVQQFNRPSINGRTLRIPIPFWFNSSSYKALPLVALQYHECDVQITFRPLQELYTVLDPSGVRVRPGRTLASFYSVNEPDYVAAGNTEAEAQEIRNFYVDWNATRPALNNLDVNARLEATYISLTDEERKVFATTPLNYLVSQIRRYTLDNITGRELFNLELSNLVSRLIILPRRSDSYDERNQHSNYTNWWNYPAYPFTPTPGASTIVNTVFSSGVLVPATQDHIIRSLRLLFNGTEYQEGKSGTYYTTQTQYKSVVGGSAPLARYMYVFPFQLDPPSDQPSGAVNASAIRLFELEVDTYPLPQEPIYLYNITIYAESYNFVTIANGLGGLKYGY